MYLNYFFILWFFCCFFIFVFWLFFVVFLLFFYSVFCLFFIFCFWLVFILTLSTFAFSICKGEGISFLYFSQRLFILLLTTAVVTLNTSSIHSFVFLFEPDKDKNKKNATEEKLNLANETVTLRTTHLFPVVLFLLTSGLPKGRLMGIEATSRRGN